MFAAVSMQIELRHASEGRVFVCERAPLGLYGVPAVSACIGPMALLLDPFLAACTGSFLQFIYLLRRNDVSRGTAALGDGDGLALSRAQQLPEAILCFGRGDIEHEHSQIG